MSINNKPTPLKKYPAPFINEFVNMKFPPREDLLSPWLPTTGLAMIYAPRGIGKTYIAIGIAYAVATGGHILGWQAPKPRPVLYIDGEMTGGMLQDRLRAVLQSHGKQPALVPLRVLNRDMITIANSNGKESPPMPDLATERGQRDLEELAKSVDLIVVDNISTLCGHIKENEADAWEPVQQWALTMRGLGKAILFIHHAGKSGQQRGTSKREDILDTIIALKPARLGDPAKGAAFDVHFEKTRGFYGAQAKTFFAQLTSKENGTQEWSRQSFEPDTKEKVNTLHHKGYTQQEIAEKLHLNKSTVSRHLKHIENISNENTE